MLVLPFGPFPVYAALLVVLPTLTFPLPARFPNPIRLFFPHPNFLINNPF
jgi:hypothetical protein